jgi:hypothetical protein
MATKQTDKNVAGATPSAEAQRGLQLGLRLQPVDASDQPLFSNFTVVQGAPGVVFVDFGFLEPAALPGLARLAKSGGKMPESINGKLACRVVLGLDAAAQLTRQLEQHLKSLAAAAATPQGKPS